MDSGKHDDWENLDSDDIASIASEDLHAHRPNRWRGPTSTWRHLTEEERLLLRSMDKLRDEDLGIHLYNAFALKRQGRDPEAAKYLTIKTVSELRTASASCHRNPIIARLFCLRGDRVG